MRELTPEEIALVNSSLETSQRNLRVESDEGEIKVSKKEPAKVKKPKTRIFLFQPLFWASLFIAIPMLVTVLLLSVISRVDAAMGSGALETLSKLSELDLKSLGFEDAGLDWIPQVVQLYEARFWILGVTWAVCLAIAALLIYAHFRRKSKYAVKEAKTVRRSLKDEMEDLNRAYGFESVSYDDEDANDRKDSHGDQER